MKIGATKKYWMPEPGIYKAEIVDIVDVGLVKSVYNGAVRWPHKLAMVTELDVRETPTKDRYTVIEYFTATLSPMGNLRGVIEEILDKELTPDEAEEYDTDELIGTKLEVKVFHKGWVKDGVKRTFCNIKRRDPLGKGKKGFKSAYVRPEFLQEKHDKRRTVEPTEAGWQGGDNEEPVGENDVHF